MDEEIRQAISEVREMKQMCGNINMKLTNIVTQRGQDWKKKLEAEYQRGLDDAWEAARKLFSSMADSDIEKAFPIEWNNGGFKALMNLQPQEAIAKLKAYEEKQKADDEIEEKITGFLDCNGYTVDEVINRLKRMKGEE